jgi:predicted aconitase
MGGCAEERGFSGLATIDRIAYPSHDSLTTLAAAAGTTSRIGLMTNIVLGPTYPPVILAKIAADRIADALRCEDAVRAVATAFEDVGVTELYFDPTVASLEQVDRLADVVL